MIPAARLTPICDRMERRLKRLRLKLLRALGVGRSSVQVAAHAFALLAVVWLLPSAVAGVFFSMSLRQKDNWVDFWLALAIWTFQIFWIVMAIRYRAKERPRKATVIRL